MHRDMSILKIVGVFKLRHAIKFCSQHVQAAMLRGWSNGIEIEIDKYEVYLNKAILSKYAGSEVINQFKHPP